MDKIVEGNKLICEFMGLVRHNEKGHPYEYGYYHQQWDWIKPVVDKIVDIAEHYNHENSIDVYKRCGDVMSTHICCSIETVWNKIVQFIQWYNAQSPINK